MSDQHEWKKKAVEGTPFTESELEEETEKLQILVFRLDGRGENVVSSIDGTIVFVDRWYSGEKVNVGEMWLCSVRYTGTVYHAMPMKKITLDVLLETSEVLRNEIVDSLWNTNRQEYEELFAERYKAEVHNQALEIADKESRQVINRMQTKIDTLTRQVEQTNYLLSNPMEEEEIVLSSEDPDFSTPVAAPKHSQTYPNGPVNESCDGPRLAVQQNPAFKVDRVSDNTLSGDCFNDGRYRVFISPNYKQILMIPDPLGMVICSKRKITLRNLEKFCPATEYRTLPAECLSGGAIRIFI